MTMTVFFLILALTGVTVAALIQWARAEYWRSMYRSTFEPVEPIDLPNLRRYPPEWDEEVRHNG